MTHDPRCYDLAAAFLADEGVILFYRGGDDVPWIYPDHPLSRAEAIKHISGDYEHLHSVVSFEIGKPSLDVTNEIVAEVVNRWADEGEPLSYRQYEFVERFAGMQVARCFQMENA